MANSKRIKANEKIADVVVGGYKAIETGVVSGYKAIETGAKVYSDAAAVPNHRSLRRAKHLFAPFKAESAPDCGSFRNPGRFLR